MVKLSFIATLLTVLLILAATLPTLVHWLYSHHGHGDQTQAFLVVFGSFLTPLLFPLFQIKTLVVEGLLPLANLSHMEGPMTIAAARWLLTPSAPFDPSLAPPEPDYSLDEFWAFNPTRVANKDAGDSVPPGLDPCPPSECNLCSAFYLHPSTWYNPAGWNAPALHPVTSYLSDDAIGPQQGTAFNSVCRIFAPRFRQAAAVSYLQPQGLLDPNSRQAMALAYSDVKRAFAHFLKHHHKGEPIIVAGHSQGALHGQALIMDFFAKNKTLEKYLVAGYLVGTTVFDVEFSQGPIGICQHKHDLGCVISWRTFGRGGDPTAFLHFAPPTPSARRICTNPLSWLNDGPRESHSANLGGLQLMHYKTMFNYLMGHRKPRDRVEPPGLIPNISDAECLDGDLYVDKLKHYGYGWGPIPFPVWTFASFPALNYHTYDYNLFFGNIRANARERVLAWIEKHGRSPS